MVATYGGKPTTYGGPEPGAVSPPKQELPNGR